MEPIIGRTHTDLFKTRNRITNIGGKGGLNLTFFSADGYSYTQVGVFVAMFLIWSLPINKLGVPWIGWGGLTLAVLLGPPFLLAWASERTLPNNKTLSQWLTTRYRYHLVEKPLYAAGKPVTTMQLNVTSQVWSPDKEGLRA